MCVPRGASAESKPKWFALAKYIRSEQSWTRRSTSHRSLMYLNSTLYYFALKLSVHYIIMAKSLRCFAALLILNFSNAVDFSYNRLVIRFNDNNTTVCLLENNYCYFLLTKQSGRFFGAFCRNNIMYTASIVHYVLYSLL